MTLAADFSLHQLYYEVLLLIISIKEMKKLIIVIYSIATYAIGFASLLYVIGFAANIVVPKSIDSGTASNQGHACIINLLLLILFGLQHSVMARPAFKAFWIRIVGSAAERSTYVLFTGMVLLLLCWQWQSMPQVIWKTENNIATTVLTILYFIGWLIVLLSTFMINHFELFGLKQAFENFAGRHPGKAVFKVNYFYTFVRHPIMLGLIISFWAVPVMTLGHLLFSVFNSLYILIAVKYLEEKDLRQAFGKEYESYQQNVPMIIPFFGSRRNTR